MVRHAHAGAKQRWSGPDQDRPLSARGFQQADGLVENLGPMRPARLLTSPYLRCRQTLAPLAARTGLRLEPCDLLLPDADVARLAQELRSGAMDDAVLCTHGETLRELRRLWSAEPVELRLNGAWPEDGHTEKGAAWLVVDEPEARTLHYFKPLHIGPVLQHTA
jgi:phosphohistidine phosphatase SixA